MPSSLGNAELRLLDANQIVLYSTKFTPSIAHADDGTSLEVATGSLIAVPVFSNGTTIQLYKDGVLQTSKTRSASAPSVTITSPPPGSTVSTGSTIQWTWSDTDGDSLKAHVLYSHNAGSSWLPLGTNLSLTQISLDAAFLPRSAGAAMIRVIVTDGFNTTTAAVSDLVLSGNNAPVVSLDQPQHGSSYGAGSNVLLIATAYDPEDGDIPEANVTWTSSLDGVIGHGYALNEPDLSVGTHAIQFAAVDALGLAATKSASITITP